MLKFNGSDNFRRTAAGVCLIAAPLVGLGSAPITPRVTGG